MYYTYVGVGLWNRSRLGWWVPMEECYSHKEINLSNLLRVWFLTSVRITSKNKLKMTWDIFCMLVNNMSFQWCLVVSTACTKNRKIILKHVWGNMEEESVSQRSSWKQLLHKTCGYGMHFLELQDREMISMYSSNLLF